jgi:hypothetical protein
MGADLSRIDTTIPIQISGTEVKMEKDSFELATGPAGETGHRENTTQMATKTTSPPLRELHHGYDAKPVQRAAAWGVIGAHCTALGRQGRI